MMGVQLAVAIVHIVVALGDHGRGETKQTDQEASFVDIGCLVCKSAIACHSRPCCAQTEHANKNIYLAAPLIFLFQVSIKGSSPMAVTGLVTVMLAKELHPEKTLS